MHRIAARKVTWPQELQITPCKIFEIKTWEEIFVRIFKKKLTNSVFGTNNKILKWPVLRHIAIILNQNF